MELKGKNNFTIKHTGNRNPFVVGVILTGLTLLNVSIFFPMFYNDFVWDDQEFIVNNPTIRSIFPITHFFKTQRLPGQGAIYPVTGARPITTISLAIDYAIWELNPFGYHLTNLLLHILCCLGVFLIARRLFHHIMLAFLSALFFALHPGHAEAVIAFLGRSDLIATLFVITGFLAYLRFNGKTSKRAIFYGLSLISLALGIFAKETGIVLFFVLILYEFILRDERELKLIEKILRLLPFLVMTIIYIFYRGYVLGGNTSGTEWWGGSVEKNFLMMFEVYARYLRLIFLPLFLSPLHTIQPPVSPFNLWFLIGLLLLIFTIGLIIILLRKHRRLSFFLLWFIAGLIPVSNIIPIPGMIMAERWLYLPSIGILTVIAWGVVEVYRKAGARLSRAWVILILMIMVIFGIRTFTWNKTWKNEENLAGMMVRTSPDNHLGWNLLGKVSVDKGRVDDAEHQFQKAIELKPEYFLAHSNLATVLNLQGRYGEAEIECRKAIELNPYYAEAYNNLGVILWRQGRTSESIEEFEKGIRLNPENPVFHFNRGLALARIGFFAAALEDMERALSLNPDNVDILFNIGVILGKMGRFNEAERFLREVLNKNDNFAEAHYNLGVIYEAQKRIAEAIREYELFLHCATYPEKRESVMTKIKKLKSLSR